MTCEFCGQAFSGLATGIVALFSFIIVPLIQILFAILGIIFEKIILLKNNLIKET